VRAGPEGPTRPNQENIAALAGAVTQGRPRMCKLHNSSLAAEQPQDRLAEFTAAAQQEHLAVGHALDNALQHAMAAGDALIAVQGLVPAGQWQAYRRTHTDISDRSARVYIQVARSREQLERQRAAGPLSIRAALEFLKEPAPAKARPRTNTERAKATASLDVLTWWSNASSEARQGFLNGIGLLALLAALPPEWRIEIERRAVRHRAAGPSKLANTLTGALKTALSLQADASANRPAAGVANALNAINNKLKSEGLDLHDVEIVVSTNAESRRCAA
jgi:hypothetical protein